MNLKVGDTVKVNVPGGDNSMRHGTTGVIADIANMAFPFRVRFPNGQTVLYVEKELTREEGMSLKVGDAVKDLRGIGDHAEQVGMISRIWEGMPFPYYVTFGDGKCVALKAIEIAKIVKVETPQQMPWEESMKFTILDKNQKQIEVEFDSIGNELFRSYLFPDEVLPDGRKRVAVIVRIDQPKWLYVSASGGHRVIDARGVSHYIPCGWKHLWWRVEEGAPYFVR